ncbi:uncharacterized protein LOC129774435 [Toxorhynchites rutilus septentrionalis]|uniref:uncharacterized protein LOC129774435 n=1 Tax=Toxorhynchites rutilus septentrionalis TaxID=329112 RepID=UPI00247A97BD|nr:uncharacterized protein LOC129774435 [Toxorhynchites rutilus septentrionalis]
MGDPSTLLCIQCIINHATITDIIISVGDFNLPNLKWQFDEATNGYIPPNVTSVHEQILVETMFTISLRQINSFVNCNGRLLDLAFVNLPEHLDLVLPPSSLLPVDNHHVPLILLIDKCCDASPLQDVRDDERNFNFRTCDFSILNNVLGDVDWEVLLQDGSLDEIVATFYDKLQRTINDHVPRRRPSSSSSFNKPWWTPDLRNMRNNLRKFRKRFFLSRSDDDRGNLRQLEASYKVLLQSTYENNMSRIQASVKQDPSRFWDFVKQRNSNNRIPHNVSYDGVNAHNNTEAADLFATFFESVFSKGSPVQRHDCYAHLPSYDIDLPDHFSTSEVLKALEDLDVKKGSGSDGIPPLL